MLRLRYETHGISVKSSICGSNTTENNVMTKLYNRIVSAKAWTEQRRLAKKHEIGNLLLKK